jgi:hypothetical protein
MPVTRYALAFALRSACPHDLGETLGEHQFPRSANRSEFGEEFGEGSLEPLTRAADRSRRSLSAALVSPQSPLTPVSFSASADVLFWRNQQASILIIQVASWILILYTDVIQMSFQNLKSVIYKRYKL